MTGEIQYNMPAGTQPWAVRERHRSRRRRVLRLPRYTVGEEVFNGVSHGIGAVAAVGALIFLLQAASSATAKWSAAVFGGSMFLLYLISCLYHSLGVNRGKKVFQVLDHCTIYLLIAGTYTPITLLAFSQPTGLILCILAWVIAVLGIVLNAADMRRFRVVSMVFYMVLGWMIIFFWWDLWVGLSRTDLLLLLAGGIFYTVGAILFGIGRKVPYMHGVFHVLCLAGSVSHFFLIYHLM
ncbi:MULTISPECIES: PAQR family membrane homeostasis protein TrhA [Caproicibacterium]|uniref:Hemolysin III family protein n=1 Tax=Caproicibacterium argilliputei TaxID=3030016 RepID=A0AA97H2F8_9FIRM|nr:hemolysin III family protein [Caproicibacterium argilliputei]WOC31068.1 hemolysin III family protein [Caproicibacterium argilliputei]